MFENRRRGSQARNFTTNAPKILDLKSSSEQIFSRKLPLGAPDWKSIYIVLLFCWKPPTARPLKWLLHLEVTWHLTIKLFPAKIIAKSMTTEGNSALLPAIRELKQKWRRRLRKRHLKRWIRSASNFAAPIPLSIRTIVVILFCSWILKDSFEVQDRKRKSLSSFTSSTKRKIYPMYY